MIVSIECHTDGKGPHTEEERMVRITKLEIGYSSLLFYPDEPFAGGTLHAHFDPYGFIQGSWNIDGFGLLYKDRLWLKEFKAGLRNAGFSIKAAQNVSYGEEVLQKYNYVSLTIGPKFYASWKRLNKINRQVVAERA